MDTIVHRKPDQSVKLTFRKKTHTDQYLNFASNHHIKQKTGIIKTFRHRIETLVTEENDKCDEEKHVTAALRRCGHPEWSLEKKQRVNLPKENTEMIGKACIPYTKGLSERLARVFRRYKIGTIHKPTPTIKNIVCGRMKDPIHELDQNGVLYKVECERHKQSYIGETARPLRARAYEHGVLTHTESRMAHSLLHKQEQTQTNQPTRRSTRATKNIDYKAMDSGRDIPLTEGQTAVSAHMAQNAPHSKGEVTIKKIGKENNWRKRIIKEAIEIKRQAPRLNEDEGKFIIRPIYEPIIGGSTVEEREFETAISDVTEAARREEEALPLTQPL